MTRVEAEVHFTAEYDVEFDEDGSINRLEGRFQLTDAQKLRLSTIASYLETAMQGHDWNWCARFLQDEVLPVLLEDISDEQRTEIVDLAMTEESLLHEDEAYDNERDLQEERR